MSDKKTRTSSPASAATSQAAKYNTVDCRCSAEQISVQNEKASTKGETYCSTFCPRGCC